MCTPGPAAIGRYPDEAGTTYRRAARDDLQLGTVQALPDRGSVFLVAGARQGAGDRIPRVDLKGWQR